MGLVDRWLEILSDIDDLSCARSGAQGLAAMANGANWLDPRLMLLRLSE